MRMVRWMCDTDINVKDRVLCKELRDTRNRGHNLGTAAKHVAMVWECVTKKTNIG